jgi:hypothetical protein
MTGSAKQSSFAEASKLDCFVASAPRSDMVKFRFKFPTADTRRHLAAGCARGLRFVVPQTEGAGNAGCALHPRSRVQNAQRKTHTSIQVQRRQSGIPCAMALRLMPCSPRRRIRLVTVAAGLRLKRSGWIDPATDSLTPATGVGTTRFCRTQQPVFAKRLRRARRRSSCAPVHRSWDKPTLRLPCAPTLPRPPHPLPRS